VQHLLGVLPKVQTQQKQMDKVDANPSRFGWNSKRDCLAGVWAARENQTLQREGKPPFIESGDVEAAMQTAAAIGDDTCSASHRRVMPDSFTHAASEQRQRWFMTGLKEATSRLQHFRT